MNAEETWESGLGPVVVHGLLNDLGAIGSATRTLLDRDDLDEIQWREVLNAIDRVVHRSIERLNVVVYGAQV